MVSTSPVVGPEKTKMKPEDQGVKKPKRVKRIREGEKEVEQRDVTWRIKKQRREKLKEQRKEEEKKEQREEKEEQREERKEVEIKEEKKEQREEEEEKKEKEGMGEPEEEKKQTVIRKRGRPRKLVTEEHTVKRKRGRPRKEERPKTLPTEEEIPQDILRFIREWIHDCRQSPMYGDTFHLQLNDTYGNRAGMVYHVKKEGSCTWNPFVQPFMQFVIQDQNQRTYV